MNIKPIQTQATTTDYHSGSQRGKKQKKAQEKHLERRLRVQVAKMGGVALKFASSFYTGWPDRLLFMPWGTVYLAEIKSEGRKVTPKQQTRVDKARRMGFKVFIIDSEAAYREAVNQLKHDYEIDG